MHWKSAWTELMSLRSLGLQGDWDPFRIFKLASIVLNKWKHQGGGGVGDEVWALLERYVIACLRLGCFKEAWPAIHRLQDRFPHSHRVGLLIGMAYEAQGDFDKAHKTYTDHLQRSEAKLPFLHRQASLSLTQSKFKPSVQALLMYLTYFPLAKDAWLVLATLYADLGMYLPALFCLEEALLLGPSFPTWVRLGEVQYTLRNYPLALMCFAHAIHTAPPLPPPPRAVYGVVQCVRQLGWETHGTRVVGENMYVSVAGVGARVAKRYFMSVPRVGM